VVPLDTTNKVPITTEFVEEFIAQALTPQAKLLASVLEHELPFIRAGAYYFWDALAASAIVDRDIFRFERRKLDVVVEYGEEATGPDIPRFSPILRSGKPRRHFDLYCSGQFIESDRGHWVDVCTDVDAGAFYARFTQVINGQPPLA
jgi:inosine-uridine nucleoside N-ribohydrolase